MLGVVVNTISVIIGSLIGMLMKKGIPERVSGAVMSVIGLCSLYIGVDGAMAGSNPIVLIVSMIFGSIIGTLLDIDGGINRLGEAIQSKMKARNSQSTIAEGFMTASLLFCVGAMTIVGSMNAGLTGDNKLLFTKSILDFVSACMLASSLGIGVLFAAAFVFVFQGSLVLLAGLLQNVLTNADIVAEITCAGSVMIMGIGLNLMNITKLKVANMLPAILLVPFVFSLCQYIPL